MLIRFDPFREFDRLTEQLWGGRQALMPMDAYRNGDVFVVHFDLPGVDPSTIDLTIENNVLTVTAERSWRREEGVQVVAEERTHGTFRRQLFLGDSLDSEHVQAGYENGVLTIRLPVADHAKPRKVEVSSGGGESRVIETSSTAA
jgi:HSP20 family protein